MSRFAKVLSGGLLTVALSISGIGVAQADADTCALSHGTGYTCIGVRGTGLYVTNTRVSHGGEGINICNYKAKVYGTLRNGNAWSTTSSIARQCSILSGYIDITVGRYFKDGSQYFGKFYHDGAWAPGAPAVNIHS